MNTMPENSDNIVKLKRRETCPFCGAKTVAGSQTPEPPRVRSGEWIEGERVRAAIAAEPELPGDMPEQMWAAVQKDRDAAVELLRIVVRLTKEGIAKRLGLEPSIGADKRRGEL